MNKLSNICVCVCVCVCVKYAPSDTAAPLYVFNKKNPRFFPRKIRTLLLFLLDQDFKSQKLVFSFFDRV